MEMVDRSGQPRRDEELLEARQAFVSEMIKGFTDPAFAHLYIFFPTIVNALDELLELRRSKE